MLRRTFAVASVAIALSMLVATNAAATLPQRTFVASYGNDANSCSLTLPCRGFAAAVVQTLPGGEVVVLDSAGYGPVTIVQSVSIVAPAGVYAGITVTAGQTGVLINGAGVEVVLRGISFQGLGGDRGAHFVAGKFLEIDRCSFSGFSLEAVRAEPETTLDLAIHDSSIARSGSGIWAATASILIERTTVLNSAQSGIVLTTAFGGWGPKNVLIRDVTVAGSQFDGLALNTSGGDVSSVTVESSRFHHNGSGIIAIPVNGSVLQLSMVNVISNENRNGIALWTGAVVPGVLKAYLTRSDISANAQTGIGLEPPNVSLTLDSTTVNGNGWCGISFTVESTLETRGNNIVRGNGFLAGPCNSGVVTPISGF